MASGGQVVGGAGEDAKVGADFSGGGVSNELNINGGGESSTGVSF